MASNNDISFRIVKSSKGTDKLSHDGYLYIFHRGTAKKEWRCDVRGCKARIHSNDENIVKKSGEHSHPQASGKEEVAVVKDLLRKRGRETKDNPHVAIGEITSLLSDSAKYLLPTQHALKMMYKRQRTAPPNPISLDELLLDGNDINTFSGKDFLFYDSDDGPNRIVIFSTQENIEYLSMSSIWLADGTFKTVPNLFCQLYTVHCLIGGPNPFENGHLLPCIYALLPNKSTSTYTKMWNIIRDACPNSQPNYIFVDFEQAAINSFKLIWPLTQVKACFFHLSQSVYRELQSLGLQSEYHNDPDFALTMRMLPGLAFVPPDLVEWSFQQLVIAFPENAYPLCRYFEENYIGLLNLNGERNTPLFPISLWNNFHLVSQGLPRTTNLVEAWHRGFQSTCGCHHPTIWKFIEFLKLEQGNVELKQMKFIQGEDPKKTKRSTDNEKAILNLVSSFFNRPILVFLRGIAFRTIF